MTPLDNLIGWLNLIAAIGATAWGAYIITMMIVGVGYLIWKRRQKMILGMKDNPTVAKLKQSNFAFHLTGEPDNLMLAKLAGVEAIYGVKLEEPDRAYRKAREAARWAMPLLPEVIDELSTL